MVCTLLRILVASLTHTHITATEVGDDQFRTKRQFEFSLVKVKGEPISYEFSDAMGVVPL